MDLKELLKAFEIIINKFEFLIDHQIYYLDEHEFELKSQIDIQREILLTKINKISKNLIDKILLFNNDCKTNLDKIQKFDLKYLKDELNRFINEERDTKNEKETENLMKNIKVSINLAQNEMNKYENEMKLNKKVTLEPIYFVDDKDLFGNFEIKANELTNPIKEFDLKFLKALNDISSDINLSIELVDENRIAVGCKSGVIKVWNINNAELVQILSEDSHKLAITCMKWLNKTEILVSGSEDQTIKVWGLNSNQLIKTLEAHSGKIMNLCFSEFYLISASSDKTINLWSIENLNHLITLDEHNGSVNNIKCSNTFLVSCSSDKTIKIWNIDYLRSSSFKTLSGHLESVIHISFIPNETNLILSYATDSMAKIWDIYKGDCLKCLVLSQHPAYENLILRLISNNLLVIVHNFQYGKWAFSIWDLERGVCVKKFKEFRGETYDMVLRNRKIFLASWDFRENDQLGCPIIIWKID